MPNKIVKVTNGKKTQELEGKNIIIATGARSRDIPAINREAGV